MIRGPNEIGKTTIAQALAFVYYGVDLYGGKNPDHLITLGLDETQVAVQSANSTFIRRKKRGKASEVKIVREGYPDLKPTQTELTKLLGIEYDLFASCVFAGHFMALSDTKKREVISQAWKADRPTLLKHLLAKAGAEQVWEQRLVKLENPRIDSDVVSRERLMVQNQYTADEGALGQIQAQMKEAMALEGDSDQLRLMEGELKSLRALCQLHELYEKDLRHYQSAMSAFAEKEAENKRRSDKQAKVKLEIEALGAAPESVTTDLDEKRAAALKRSTDLKLVANPEQPPIPTKVNEDTCLRCGQRVGEKLKADISAERDRLTMEYNELQRSVADQNAAIMKEREGLEEQVRLIGTQINERRQARLEWDTKKRYLDRTLTELAVSPNHKPNPPEAPEGATSPESIPQAREQLATLEAKYQAQKLMEGRAAGLAAREHDLKHALVAKKSKIDALQTLQDCLRDLPNLEVEQTMSKFKLHHTQVAFIEGEVVVANEQGLPYLSLSSGRRMKVDLEWAKCFQRLVPNAPKFIFIDNADLVDSFDGYWPEEMQVLMVQVRADLKQLEVVQL